MFELLLVTAAVGVFALLIFLYHARDWGSRPEYQDGSTDASGERVVQVDQAALSEPGSDEGGPSLQRLLELREAGVITRREFKAAARKYLR